MRNTIIAATTAAVATAREVNAQSYASITLSADNLATTEEVDIQIDGKAVTDTAGTVQKLTATIPALVLQGGVTYSVLKDATAGACAVHMWTGPSLNGR